jgi:hypothetical protein
LLDRGRYDRYVGARAGGHDWTTLSYNVRSQGCDSLGLAGQIEEYRISF